jgi:hypothetical protein
MSTTTIQRDEKSGRWLVCHDNKTVEFDGNHAGRVQANRFALAIDRPELVELVKRLIAKHNPLGLEDRAWRAADIIASGQVTMQPADCHNNVGRVRSQSGNDVYTIQKRETLLCLCEDYQSQRAPMLPNTQRLCKHVLAFCLAYELAGRPSFAAPDEIETPAVQPRPKDRYGRMLVPGSIAYRGELVRLANNGYQPTVKLDEPF